MRIATWNVNSLNVRLPHVLDWLGEQRPDVLMLQETKLTDDRFPVDALRDAGYHAVFTGQKTYNGVAILSREPPEGVIREFPEVTGRAAPHDRRYGRRRPRDQPVRGQRTGRRLGEVRVQARVAAPGHRAPAFGAPRARAHRVFAGDFNIAPEDRDVHDPEEWKDSILLAAVPGARWIRSA